MRCFLSHRSMGPAEAHGQYCSVLGTSGAGCGSQCETAVSAIGMHQRYTLHRCIGGMTSTGPDGLSTSTVYTLAMSGTSTTKPIMTMTTHLLKLSRATSSTSSFLISYTRSAVQASRLSVCDLPYSDFYKGVGGMRCSFCSTREYVMLLI